MTQQAEKLPLFEAKIAELTEELNEKELEIQGLREGMQEMRLMYRQHLDELLEEKAASTPAPERLKVPLEEMALEYQEQCTAGYSASSDVAAASFDLPFSG